LNLPFFTTGRSPTGMALVTLVTPLHTSCQLGSLTGWVSSPSYAKRVFVGQRIELRHTEKEFEVCDGQGALLAFGDFDSRPRTE
ncbi:MAG: hypothetical protein ACLQAT_17340, partial [Candidatus Binataceae bacterium]